jgi:hypothetical protein
MVSAKKRGRFTCVASRAATGWFSALGPGRGGTIVAPTLAGLREQAEQIAAKLDKDLHFEPAWSGATYDKVYRALDSRRAAEAAHAKAQALLSDAAGALMEEGFSVRDAAVVLELSHQRVHQLFQEQQAKRRKRGS